MGSLHKSAYHKSDIVNSFNIFVDTDRISAKHSSDKGDSLNIHLEGQAIEARDGEIIRVSLVNFTMFNNLYMVDNNNNKYHIASKVGAGSFVQSGELTIESKNYANLGDLANAFADSLVTYITSLSLAGVTSVTKTSVAPTGTLNSTSNRLLDITITTDAVHGLTEFNIQTRQSNDSYLILGSERVLGGSNTDQSFKVTFPTTTTIRIQGYFPMQRMSDPFVYLRCENNQNGLEMNILSPLETGVDVLNSNVLAKLFRDVEFISYNANTGTEYFMNLQQRKLASLRLSLTDHRGRKLGRTYGENGFKTAAGLRDSSGNFEKDTQSTLGNLNFTCVLKVDIIKMYNPHMLESPMPPPLPIPSKGPGVVVTQGMSRSPLNPFS
jgi:hypothetical protein